MKKKNGDKVPETPCQRRRKTEQKNLWIICFVPENNASSTNVCKDVIIAVSVNWKKMTLQTTVTDIFSYDIQWKKKSGKNTPHRISVIYGC